MTSTKSNSHAWKMSHIAQHKAAARGQASGKCLTSEEGRDSSAATTSHAGPIFYASLAVPLRLQLIEVAGAPIRMCYVRTFCYDKPCAMFSRIIHSIAPTVSYICVLPRATNHLANGQVVKKIPSLRVKIVSILGSVTPCFVGTGSLDTLFAGVCHNDCSDI